MASGVSVYADASAALGIVQRRGVGKLRHIRTQSLWLQEAIATKRIHFEKVDGSRNPADLLTKHLAEILMDRHMKVIGALPEDGRASTAPTLASLGINEQPLYGHTAQDPSQRATKLEAQSGLKHAIDQQKPCMRYGGHGRFIGQVVCGSQTGVGAWGTGSAGGQRSSEDGFPCLGCPALHADDSPTGVDGFPCLGVLALHADDSSAGPHELAAPASTNGAADVRSASSCLERGLHPVEETSSSSTRRTNGKVSAIALHRGIVSGSSLKPCHMVGQMRDDCCLERGLHPVKETSRGVSPCVFSGVRRNRRPRCGGVVTISLAPSWRIPLTHRFRA